MKARNWYPAATLSVLLLSCGGATSDEHGGKPGSTGGNSNIDSGAPAATGGMPMVFYGIRMPSGGTSDDSGVTSSGVRPSVGGGSTIEAPTGGQGVTIYGPRFDKLEAASISSGGNRAVIGSDAEGGANASTQRLDP